MRPKYQLGILAASLLSLGGLNMAYAHEGDPDPCLGNEVYDDFVPSRNPLQLTLGEFWVANQSNTVDELWVFKDSNLWEYGPADGDPGIVHLHHVNAEAEDQVFNEATCTPEANRLHIIGFNNYKGLESKSRAILSYLSGRISFWKTHGANGMPEYLSTVDASTVKFDGTPSGSLHMGGPNPANTMVAVVSIGNREFALISTDYDTDTYAKVSGVYTKDMTLSPAATAQTAVTWAALLVENAGGPTPVCANWDTTSRYVYVTMENPRSLMIVDTVNPLNPQIVNAYGPDVVTSEGGCGLVNDPAGKHMWTNAGGVLEDAVVQANGRTNPERVYRWAYADIGTDNLPKSDLLPTIKYGDVHGAQFAGLFSLYRWDVKRLDGTINVVDRAKVKVVNTFNYAVAGVNYDGDLSAGVQGVTNFPGGDVIDRSPLGERMFLTMRGGKPITAIVGTNVADNDRNPGVSVLRPVLFGKSGTVVHHVPLRKLHTSLADISVTDAQDTALVDPTDPHGGKSLSYLTGGF